MPRTPDDPADPSVSRFFQRWSERKLQGEAAPPQTGTAEAERETSRAPTHNGGDEIVAAEGERAPPVSEADLEGLTYQSDYTKFMGDGVPDAIRQRALRQLWRSDPILANVDGLCDYDLDYTDAALAVDVLKTAYKVGQGYLTDDDLAANRARGEPQGADEEAETIADAEAGEAANGETGQGDAAAADGDGGNAETVGTFEAEVDGASEIIAADDPDSDSGGSGGEMAAVVAKQTRDAG